MFGINYISFDAMTHVIHYKNGRVVQEGRGLAFFYFAPSSSIAAIPLGSNDLPFIFAESTRDHQSITIQGQVSYKVGDPKQLAELLDFTVDGRGLYKKNDLEKLNQRIVNEAQTATASYIHGIGLKDAIRSAKAIEEQIELGIKGSKAITSLGVEVLAVNVLAVKASPEMARALETETRERLQQEADQAIFERRNFAVEQERKIKESELNTEIAVEEKRKQIAEKVMESDVQKAENDRKLRELKVQADIAVEDQRKLLIDQKSANERKEADAQGYVLETTLKPYKEMDWRTLMALRGDQDARSNIAMAFRELAENAGKVGTLNISPDLLESLLGKEDAK
jgi:regulator of protease activity HflC (stomatin/prohibitin superfamily)